MSNPLKRRIVVLTGAGVSAESGLGTFRDEDGIWTKYPLEDLATPEGFARNPVFVHGFYNDRRRQLATAKPNPAHFALAGIEQAVAEAGGRFTLVTQNVDNLHEQAGSRTVLHMHGELTSVFCTECSQKFAWRTDLGLETACRSCGSQGYMRPDIVWFGEMPYFMDEIEAALGDCDLFVSIGTSGTVYPAAGFVQIARYHGADTLELNLAPSDGASLFRQSRYGPASEIVPAWAGELTGHKAGSLP